MSLENQAEVSQRDELLAIMLLLCNDEKVAQMTEEMIAREHGPLDTPSMRELREKGRRFGHEDGLTQGTEQVIIWLLERRIGPLDETTLAQLHRLPFARLSELFDAAFDFQGTADLTHWLASYGQNEERPTAEEKLFSNDGGLPITPMIRKLMTQGHVQGYEQGEAEGLTQGAIIVLQQRVGPLDAATQEQIRRLPAARVYELLDAVFGLESMADLHAWLAAHAEPDTA